MADYATIAASGIIVHVAWRDYRFNQEWHLGYKYSLDNGVTWKGDTLLVANWQQEGPSIAVAGTKVHLAWIDNRESNWEIYYKRNPTGNPVGIENHVQGKPGLFTIYPNPFSTGTTFEYSIPSSCFTTLEIFDPAGRKIATLVSRSQEPGLYQSSWNAEGIPAGVYLCRLQAIVQDGIQSGFSFTECRKLMVQP